MHQMTYAFVTRFCNPHSPEDGSPQQCLRKARIIAQCDTFGLKTREDGELILAREPWLLLIDAEELSTEKIAVDVSAIPLGEAPPPTSCCGETPQGGKRPPPSSCGV